jgi:tetratricopeptide (TPR) repeat protein
VRRIYDFNRIFIILADNDSFWGVFWVDIGSPSIAKSDFIAVAKTLGALVESIDDARQVLANTKKSWLLILDNADDPVFDYQVYLPSGTHGAVMITSRLIDCSRYSTVGSEELTGLDIHYSTQLLLKAAEIPEKLWPPYSQQAKDVVSLLGSHTLALIQAGAYIAKGHSRLDQYPEVYRQQRKRLLKYRPSQSQSRYCDVYATFEASAHVLEFSESEAAKDALHLLEILSMLHSSFLPLQIFEDAWEGSWQALHTNDAEISIETLCRWHVSRLPDFMVVEGCEWDSYRLVEASSLLASLSLITRHSSAGVPGLSMHPLAHAWAKDRQEVDQQGDAWIAASCILALSTSTSDVWQRQERHLRPHMQSCLNIKVKTAFSLGSVAMLIPIFLKCGWALLRMRDDSRLGHLLKDIFSELEMDPTKLSKECLPIYDLNARSLMNLGHHTKAVELFEQVVKIEGTVLAEDHPDRLASQHELAIAYEANGQVAEAVELLEHVVKIRGTVLAEDHPDRLASQHALAGAYEADGQVAKAVELLEQVVKIEGTMLAEDHPSRLVSQHVLAIAYEADGQVAKAVELLEHVVKIRGTVLAEDHPDRLASQHALAGVYRVDGQVAKAIELLEQVVKIEGTVLAEDHPSRLASQHALAITYEADGQVSKAVELLEHVVKIEGTVLAKDYPSRIISEQALATCLQKNITKSSESARVCHPL